MNFIIDTYVYFVRRCCGNIFESHIYLVPISNLGGGAAIGLGDRF
jgi:hypothetical protein